MPNDSVRPKKKLFGEVVSDKMDKTAVVKISSAKSHSKYFKKYIVSKRYHVHDENNEYKVGDIVEIEETRPISRHKKWIIVKKIK